MSDPRPLEESLDEYDECLIKTDSYHLYVPPEGDPVRFDFERQSEATSRQYKGVKRALENDLFERYLSQAKQLSEEGATPDLSEGHRELLSAVVKGIHNKGRGIASVCCVQLLVKACDDRLDIRLHKGSRLSNTFGWQEGWSLRTLDQKHIGPVLTERNLLLNNNDGGGVMTRQLAESEPYTPLFGMALAGPREEWLEVVDLLEAGEMEPEPALLYFLQNLYRERETVEGAGREAMSAARRVAASEPTLREVEAAITAHMQQANTPATLLEVALHSLLQAVDDADHLDGALAPLEAKTAPDRRAGETTREARGVGDIQIVGADQPDEITQAWDAKHKDVELSNELDGLREKLDRHPTVERVTYVTDPLSDPGSVPEPVAEEFESEYGVQLATNSLAEFSRDAALCCAGEPLIEPGEWLCAYVETLANQREDRAEMRESPLSWLRLLRDLLIDEFDLSREQIGEAGGDDHSADDESDRAGQQAGLDAFD